MAAEFPFNIGDGTYVPPDKPAAIRCSGAPSCCCPFHYPEGYVDEVETTPVIDPLKVLRYAGFDWAADEIERLRSGVVAIDSYISTEGGEWVVEDGVRCVVCPGCAFTFDAHHTDVNGGGYSCPECGEGNGSEATP